MDRKRERTVGRTALTDRPASGGTVRRKVTVSFANDTSVEYALRGRAEEDVPMDAIEIKKNTRTIVLFNGKDKETFEVRYAGFADGNDATVDVDDDAWDGV